MANTRRVSFRLGGETEQKLNELAQLADSSRTEVVRSLITNRYAELPPDEKPTKHPETDSTQMILDEILSNEIRVER